MKFFILIFAFLIYMFNSKEETNSLNKRLTFEESFDLEKTHYILNSQEDYKEIKNLVKNETIKNSSTYSYEWSNHPKKLSINFKAYLPQADSSGYRDMTKYDTIYLNIYSNKILPTKVTIVIECQEREPDEYSDMRHAFKVIKYLWILLVGKK